MSNNSKIQTIAVCALYSKPDSRKKTLLLDHISDAYNILNTKYGKDLHFVIGGDTNDLKLGPILSLSSNFVQVVQKWTRMNPPALLDPVIMTLANYYQEPMCLEPLDPDPDKNGVKSDHRIVLIRPLNIINKKSVCTTREIKVRPFPQSGFHRMRKWFIDQSWEQVYEAQSAHQKAEMFQTIGGNY